MSDKVRAFLRMLLGIIMGLVGVVIILMISVGGSTGPEVTLVTSLGVALITTGTITVFQEGVLLPLQKDETKKSFEKVVESINVQKSETKKDLERVIDLVKTPGIHLLAPERHRHPRFHRWMLEKKPQELFFAGHSVLHRVQADFSALDLPPVHEALQQKISEGSRFRILFIDPTWEFLDLVAKGEVQEPDRLRHDLVTTLKICKDLWEVLQNEENLAGEIDIRACAETTQ